MRNFFRYFFAIFLIVIGVMLVMANLEVIDFNFSVAWHYIYPIFFVVIGFMSLIRYLGRRGGSWIFGSFFAIFGSLLIMDRLDWMTFAFKDVINLWPLLIVYIGFSLIGRNRVTINYSFDDDKNHDYDYDTGWHKKYFDNSMFSVGSQTFEEQNWVVEPMHLKHMAGDFYFNFSKAFIPEKKIPITIDSLAADVNIVVPENIDFRIHARVKAGGIQVLDQASDGINRTFVYQTNNYDAAVKKLDFYINLKAGNIRIDRV